MNAQKFNVRSVQTLIGDGVLPLSPRVTSARQPQQTTKQERGNNICRTIIPVPMSESRVEMLSSHPVLVMTLNEKKTATPITESDDLRHTRLPLNNGSGAIPALGFGTLISDPIKTRNATKMALKTGFRALDTAERYRTEKEVGDAMKEVFKAGEIRREDVFVATKLWNTNHRPERVKPAFEASLKKLQVDYVDLYLIHTPFAFKPGDEQDPRDAAGNVLYDDGVRLIDTWRALEKLVVEGKCKAIGLSDIKLEKLKEIVAAATIPPAVVHVESHPYLPEWELLRYCQMNGIVLQAFAALGHSSEPNLLADPVITGIATRLGKTPAQVALAWAIQRGTALLTTSRNLARIRENFDVSALPEAALREINERTTMRMRFNPVVDTGVPGFIPRGK